MVAWSHYIHPSEVERGDHVYALRGFGTYQHHGVIITGADACRLIPKPGFVEMFMVIEQNIEGLSVVTLEQFTYEDGKVIKGHHYLRRIKIYNREKEEWSTYSLLQNNCEHLAFVCCTGIGILSEQILAKYDIVTNAASTVVMTIAPVVWGYCKNLLKTVIRIGENLVPSSIANLSTMSLDEVVKTCLPAAGWAIETKEYLKCLVQVGVANGISFGMSIVGTVVDTFILLPGATIGFSILFGFISYVVGRWATGAVINLIQQMIDEK